MAAPVTRQVSGCAGPILTPTGSNTEPGQPLATAVADLPVLDASGRRVSFGALFRERRAVVVFVRVSRVGRDGKGLPEAAPLLDQCGYRTSPGIESLNLPDPATALLTCSSALLLPFSISCVTSVKNMSKIWPKSPRAFSE